MPPRSGARTRQLTIEVQTLARTRYVRLNLSDGREITSHVAIVPAKLGGPAGFYYQVVHGPSPIPVSLTEVDAHGKVLRTVKLPRTADVSSSHEAPQTGAEAHAQVIRKIAAVAPQGPSFSIIGERSGFDGGERPGAIAQNLPSALKSAPKQKAPI